MFQNQVSGITVLDPKTWACDLGDPASERRGQPSAQAPLTLPTSPFIHTTLVLSQEGPGCPPVTCWSHHHSRHRPHPGPSLLPSPLLNFSPPSWKPAPSFPAIPDCSVP